MVDLIYYRASQRFCGSAAKRLSIVLVLFDWDRVPSSLPPKRFPTEGNPTVEKSPPNQILLGISHVNFQRKTR